ncbi:MAG: hypothetical protein IPN61_18550 [Bacteroidetes bacterium]|nr:hypothetical protein [Bacteroidota bacterium]
MKTNNLYRLGVEPDGADGFMAIYEFDREEERGKKFKKFRFLGLSRKKN